MVIRLILQPHGIACCAQACCAMLTNLELDKVCKEFGHQHSSYTKEVVQFLRNHGYTCPDRLKITKKDWVPPDLCILRLRIGKRLMGHMVVYQDGVVYDPAIGKRLLGEYERMTSCDGPVRVSSYLPITERGAVNEKSHCNRV